MRNPYDPYATFFCNQNKVAERKVRAFEKRGKQCTFLSKRSNACPEGRKYQRRPIMRKGLKYEQGNIDGKTSKRSGIKGNREW